MLISLALSLFIDLVLGEPPAKIHPVVWTGKISERFIKPYSSRPYGIFIWCISVLPILLPSSLALYYIRDPIFQILVSTYFIKISFSIKLLYKIVYNSKDLDENAKYWVQQIVRRNVYELDRGHVASAAIESLFESTVDGITSPLFWYIVLGPFGALLQRLSNTMDSMVGYKTPELKDQGWFSAKVDTILNFIPARITGYLMILLGMIFRLNWRNAIKALKESKMESVNAKYPIAIAAGLLNVRLEKPGYYSVGSGNLPDTKEIIISLNFFKALVATYLALVLIIDYYLYGLTFFSYPYGIIEFFYSKFMSY
ncbi:MAG: cobalamin biosynthesis protein [Sulfolobaceae archaeon]